MEPERWRQIEQVFQSALDCEPSRRSAFLETACAGDPALRDEIETLLASYSEGGFTATPAFEDALRLLERRHSLEGRRVGAYRLIREIGQGGMGAVYLAARADDAFQKEAAVKIIRRGFDAESIARRFREERQILASLDHPNITRLLDGGTAEDGSPYFVMEYVRGEPIDRYCDERKLSVTGRLRLFQSVCAAVHYAHQNLVIHRDIKPGNILVTLEGVPKLLDFGIAKLLRPGPGIENAGATQTVFRPMTPEYASPEQLQGKAVTTASDVYSLGALLYELLTGRRPHRLEGRLPAEAERVICQEEPEKPSVSIARAEGALTPNAVADARETSPEKLRRRLRGDLDNIVLMALRPEPQRRYGSVEQFSRDIQRSLDGLPVLARPDTPGYRTAKFVARHKAGVTAAALLALTMAAGIAATLWQARIALAERDRARLETAKEERINAFLQKMLSFSNPGWASPNLQKNQDIKVSEVVGQAAKRAEAELSGQPEVLSDVQRTIGNVYFTQGRWDQAEPLLRAAFERQTKLYGPENRETALTAHDLAAVLFRQGKVAEAEPLFRKAVDVYLKEAHGRRPDYSRVFGVLGDLGAMLGQKGDVKGAQACFYKALEYAPKLSGMDRAQVGMVYNELAGTIYVSGDLNEAERLLWLSVEEFRKLPPGNYSEMAITLVNLGTTLLRKGQYAEAEPLIREGVEINRKVLGNDHFTTAGSLVALAELLCSKGDFASAEAAVRESLGIFGRTVPEGSIAFAAPLTQLGRILTKSGRSRQAEAPLREALAIRTRSAPGGKVPIAVVKGMLGECLTDQKRYAEAEPLLKESHEAMKSLMGERDPRTAEAAQRLSALYDRWGKPARK